MLQVEVVSDNLLYYYVVVDPMQNVRISQLMAMQNPSVVIGEIMSISMLEPGT
jgi:hypothetical protein